MTDRDDPMAPFHEASAALERAAQKLLDESRAIDAEVDEDLAGARLREAATRERVRAAVRAIVTRLTSQSAT